ncbi:hypothetical protein MKW94_020912 [Papaver nudicaule]|uniref:Uncharacterized protein n=1 Tax=Papaver nudicaule TaxID=74823 RepID=A0AA41SFP8_PAPNU|nr:hypothetical protein [Papaver nudicaule]
MTLNLGDETGYSGGNRNSMSPRTKELLRDIALCERNCASSCTVMCGLKRTIIADYMCDSQGLCVCQCSTIFPAPTPPTQTPVDSVGKRNPGTSDGSVPPGMESHHHCVVLRLWAGAEGFGGGVLGYILFWLFCRLRSGKRLFPMRLICGEEIVVSGSNSEGTTTVTEPNPANV